MIYIVQNLEYFLDMLLLVYFLALSMMFLIKWFPYKGIMKIYGSWHFQFRILFNYPHLMEFFLLVWNTTLTSIPFVLHDSIFFMIHKIWFVFFKTCINSLIYCWRGVSFKTILGSNVAININCFLQFLAEYFPFIYFQMH